MNNGDTMQPDVGDIEYNSGDRVALAVDSPKPDRWDIFWKNAIASGSIVPPSGESAAVRRSDFLTGLCVICFVTLGAAAFLLAMLWRH